MKILLIIIIINTMSVIVYGQKKESVLWEISGNGLSKNSYLFGTDHTAPVKLLNDFPKIKSIIKKCDFGLLEKDPDGIGDIKDAEIKTPPLDSVFTKSEYTLVDSFFTSSSYGSIKPHNNEASLLAMAQAVIMLKTPETKSQGMFFDEYIHDFIDSIGKNTFGLDEPLEMAKSAAKTDHRRLAELIVWLISNKFEYSDTSNFYDQELYIASLLNNLRFNEEATKEVNESTIERHSIWLPKIMTKMNEGSCFVAVGLGHLMFKTGLIQLLRQRGYNLRPVKLEKYGL